MQQGLERHLLNIQEAILSYKPTAVIADPISNLIMAGSISQTKSMLVRLVDFLKMNNITCLFTSLTHDQKGLENTNEESSSIVDTWILLRDIEINGERNRGLYILKSRGMAHSNQIREFLLTNSGIELKDAYLGPNGVLTGSARAAQEQEVKKAALANLQESTRRKRELDRKRQALEAQLAVLQSDLESVNDEAQALRTDTAQMDQLSADSQTKIAGLRSAND